MLASPGRVVRSNWSCGLAPRRVLLRVPSWRIDIFGLKPRACAVDRVEVGGEVGDRALVADPLGGDRGGIAVGRVDHEVGLVDVDLDRAHPDRDAADDRRHRFGVRDHMGVGGIDVEGHAHHHGAVVIGACESGRDRNQAEGRALEGPRQVHLPVCVEGMGAGAGGDVGGADLRGGGTARGDLLFPARLLGRRRYRGLRAIGHAAQVRGQPRRHREIELAEELVSVFPIESQGE